MKTNRMKLSILNSVITTGTQILTIILRFVTQTIFIHTLGASYLGINGLFTNIISVLSFADLGIGAAITYSLYKPMAEGNIEIINSIMFFFRKAYHIIGFSVALLGLVVMPFLDSFIKNNNIDYIELIFLLFLLNVVISYFFSYNQTLLIADQQGYKCSIVQVIFLILKVLLQIIVLLLFQSFFLYLLIQIIITLSTNIFISKLVIKQYPSLNMKRYVELPKDIYIKIKDNTIGMIGSKFGEIALSASDNIIMSMFIGLSTVGVYSNYVLLVNSASTLLTQFVGSVSASIGNFAVDVKDTMKQYELFKRHLFINNLVTILTSACLVSLLNPFIILWIGDQYILPTEVVDLMILNFVIISLRQTPITFISSYGLFKKIGLKSIIEAIVNVVVSVALVVRFNMGIRGVLIGTLVSNIIVNLFYEPFVVTKYGLNVKKYLDFIKSYIFSILTILFSCLTVQIVMKFMNLGGVLGLFVILCESIFISLIFFILFNIKSKEFKFFLGLLMYTYKDRFLKR